MLNSKRLSSALRTLYRLSLFGGTVGATAIVVTNSIKRHHDDISGKDRFSKHIREQHKEHLFSGMHEPLIPNPAQLVFFQKYFPQYLHLLPSGLKVFKQQQALKTPVKIRPLSECPVTLNTTEADTLAVGGPPALLSAVAIVKQGKPLTYINDQRRMPIAFGSAWHLEQDAETEAPTSYRPTRFLSEQILRAGIGYVSHAAIEQSGLFPWRTLDWVGWIRHPEQWAIGMKVMFAFQLATMASGEQRQATVQKVALQCKANEQFYSSLDKELGGKLLLPGSGSIIVARNIEEVTELNAMKESLAKEGRTLNILSKKDMQRRFGFAPNGLMYAEKPHDRVLSPKFMELLSDHIQKQGGKVINGTLTTVYADDQNAGGVAEYRTMSGQRNFIPYSRLILSLGSQPILDHRDNALFDVVAARGVSILAQVTVPSGYQLPPVIVCGGTNHVTKLSEKPVIVQGDDGKSYDLYLMRMTAGACITPNVSDEDAVNYDGTIALGLVTAARQTFGQQCRIEPITVYGCNRQVSQYGQTNWINPLPGIHIQYGAGGGGLTRAPDFAVNEINQSSQKASMTP
jgi:hypothetical protein